MCVCARACVGVRVRVCAFVSFFVYFFVCVDLFCFMTYKTWGMFNGKLCSHSQTLQRHRKRQKDAHHPHTHIHTHTLPQKQTHRYTYNPNLTKLILKPLLMYLNVFSYWRYLQKHIQRVNATQYNITDAHSYIVLIYIQKLQHFCNTSPLMMAQSWTENT